MSTKWKNLRNDELEAFAACSEAQTASNRFFLHLSKHGSAQTIHNFINAAPDPLAKSFDVFAFCPEQVNQWFIKTLKSNPASQTHFKIAWHIVANLPSLHLYKIDCAELLDCIDFSVIPDSHRQEMFRALVHAGKFDIVRTYWSVYKDAVEHNAQENVIYAAEYALDIRTRVPWTPTTKEDRQKYFIACCTGGLVARARECRIENKCKDVLRYAFYLTCLRNPSTDETLNYLWNTYPNSQWFKEPGILHAAVDVSSSSIRQNIVQHFKRNALTVFNSHITQLACRALESEKDKAFQDLFTHVSSHDYSKLIKSAVLHKRTWVFKKLMKTPDAQNNLNIALQGLDQRDAQWATRIASAAQKSILEKELKPEIKHKDKKSPRRKM